MLENLLVIILVVLAIIMIAVILLQPDRSQGLAKNANIVDEEKEGIEKFTEWIAIAFLVVAVLFQIIR